MVTVVNNIALGTHPADDSIILKGDIAELEFKGRDPKPYAVLGVYVKHSRTTTDGTVELRDMDRFVTLTLDNTNQFPTGNPAMPYIGDLEYFLMQAKAGVSLPEMCTTGVQAVLATVIQKMYSKSVFIPNDEVVVTYDHTDETAEGESDGTITLTVSGGTSPYFYSWSNGETTKDLTGLTAGTYTCTVSDSSIWTGDVTVNISVDVPTIE